MNPKPDFSLRRASWRDDADRIRAVRLQVFVLEQKIPEHLEWDAADANALHLLALTKKRDAVGTVRLEASGKIGRLAVMANYRRLGIGSGLLVELVKIAADEGLKRVYLHAQRSATAFYERHGFVCEGEPFDEGGIEHVVASMELMNAEHDGTGKGKRRTLGGVDP
jgi:predicted GNAT family N-acyltransferase